MTSDLWEVAKDVQLPEGVEEGATGHLLGTRSFLSIFTFIRSSQMTSLSSEMLSHLPVAIQLFPLQPSQVRFICIALAQAGLNSEIRLPLPP